MIQLSPKSPISESVAVGIKPSTHEPLGDIPDPNSLSLSMDYLMNKFMKHLAFKTLCPSSAFLYFSHWPMVLCMGRFTLYNI
jgi:hypothetical protein